MQIEKWVAFFYTVTTILLYQTESLLVHHVCKDEKTNNKNPNIFLCQKKAHADAMLNTGRVV